MNGRQEVQLQKAAAHGDLQKVDRAPHASNAQDDHDGGFEKPAIDYVAKALLICAGLVYSGRLPIYFPQ